MDQDRFDGLTRALGAAASRRGLGRALAGGGLAALVGSAFGALAADAKKKKRRKKRKKKTRSTPPPLLVSPPPPPPPPPRTCTPECGFNTVCQDGTCVAAANQCPVPFVCSDPVSEPAPICGTMTGGGLCACFTSTEGNNICFNNGKVAGLPPPCTSSQECHDTVGVNFYCMAVDRSPSGKVCGFDVPRCMQRCDNPA